MYAILSESERFSEKKMPQAESLNGLFPKHMEVLRISTSVMNIYAIYEKYHLLDSYDINHELILPFLMG